MFTRSIATALCLGTAACATPTAAPPVASAPQQVDGVARTVLAQPNVAGIGMARIENGRVVWMDFWGEQDDDISVGPQTAFNVASVAKTVLAETTYRIADRTDLDLDDPIAAYYEHPELSKDARYARLTPRILLSHQAGLLNWADSYDDGKLAFIDEPGNGEVHYSGAGITIVMRYLEARYGKPYPELVDEYLFDPLGIEEIAVGREEWLDGRVASPIDARGKRYAPFTNDSSGALITVGAYNPADNLYATVPGYARLLVALIGADDLSPEMQQARRTLLSRSDSALGYVCVAAPKDCPDPLGYGPGWTLFGEPERMILNHSGNDFGEHAQVYFSPDTREGLVLFMNGGDAFELGLRLLEATDPDLLMARHYRALFDQMAAKAE